MKKRNKMKTNELKNIIREIIEKALAENQPAPSKPKTESIFSKNLIFARESKSKSSKELHKTSSAFAVFKSSFIASENLSKYSSVLSFPLCFSLLISTTCEHGQDQTP